MGLLGGRGTCCWRRCTTGSRAGRCCEVVSCIWLFLCLFSGQTLVKYWSNKLSRACRCCEVFSCIWLFVFVKWSNIGQILVKQALAAWPVLRGFFVYLANCVCLVVKHWSNTGQTSSRGLAGAARLFRVFGYLYVCLVVKHWSNTGQTSSCGLAGAARLFR